ncbi:hypothetical protein OEIGOIKO_04704 [Streptomyces chrestomyceticus JCM 4735]|uniref:DUF306 domain-containing protein n=1 Tax=Streptomyces chrestomyceticus JCM 4735 TaxID=1306181 RepID=A0A7U9PZ13_9ACTN|nr:hypothetical protein OEIGOIKO_04704 [Streptomyces chrestomyceticus JCM 4735]
MALAAVSACGAPPPPAGGSGRGTPASASPSEKGPGGVGGSLSHGIWEFYDVTAEGATDRQDGHGIRPWVEFHDDGTATGSYGCATFRVNAELRSTRLALGEEVGTPPPTPSPRDSSTLCTSSADKPYVDQNERSLKRFLRGPLTITRKPPEKPTVPGRPARHDEIVLKNERGESATASPVMFEGFFTTRYRPKEFRPENTVLGFASADEDLYWDFHPGGVVTGKLGCNAFSAAAEFSGTSVYFHGPKLITHRTCPGPNSADEHRLLGILDAKRYEYKASESGMWVERGYHPDNSLLSFEAVPRP